MGTAPVYELQRVVSKFFSGFCNRWPLTSTLRGAVISKCGNASAPALTTQSYSEDAHARTVLHSKPDPAIEAWKHCSEESIFSSWLAIHFRNGHVASAVFPLWIDDMSSLHKINSGDYISKLLTLVYKEYTGQRLLRHIPHHCFCKMQLIRRNAKDCPVAKLFEIESYAVSYMRYNFEVNDFSNISLFKQGSKSACSHRCDATWLNIKNKPNKKSNARGWSVS